jgi:DNA replication protein DnaC
MPLSPLDNITSVHAVAYATLEHEVKKYGEILRVVSESVASVGQEDVAWVHLSLAARDHSLVEDELRQLLEQAKRVEQNDVRSQQKEELENKTRDLRATIKSNIKVLEAIHRYRIDSQLPRQVLTLLRRVEGLQRNAEPPSSLAPVAKRSALSTKQRQEYLDSLKFEQLEARHATIKAAHSKTCKWLLKKPEYQDWLDTHKISDHHGFLWIKGNPGTGKSTIMKFAFANAKKSMKDVTVISFFFNARGDLLEKSCQGILLVDGPTNRGPSSPCT